MRSIAIVVSTLLVAAWIAPLAAQDRPALAGTWTLDADKTAAARAEGRAASTVGTATVTGGGMMTSLGRGASPNRDITLSLDDATFVVRRPAADGEATYTHFLDGRENVSRNDNTTTRSITHWKDGRLVVTQRREVDTSQGSVTVAITEEYWLDAEGDLRVSTSRKLGDNPATSSTQVYVRKS